MQTFYLCDIFPKTYISSVIMWKTPDKCKLEDILQTTFKPVLFKTVKIMNKGRWWNRDQGELGDQMAECSMGSWIRSWNRRNGWNPNNVYSLVNTIVLILISEVWQMYHGSIFPVTVAIVFYPSLLCQSSTLDSLLESGLPYWHLYLIPWIFRLFWLFEECYHIINIEFCLFKIFNLIIYSKVLPEPRAEKILGCRENTG